MMRGFLGAFLLLLSLPSMSAEFFVVEIANFSCPHCRAMENQIPVLESEVRRLGGELRFAPVSWGTQSNWRDRVFFASRKQGSQAALTVRRLLYRGAQEARLPFSDLAQVLAWLRQAGAKDVDLDKLQADARHPDAEKAADKAVFLAVRAGVTKVPSFVLIKDGEIHEVVSRSETLTHPVQIRNAVIEAAEKMSRSSP